MLGGGGEPGEDRARGRHGFPPAGCAGGVTGQPRPDAGVFFLFAKSEPHKRRSRQRRLRWHPARHRGGTG